jgi:hypothetical protein
MPVGLLKTEHGQRDLLELLVHSSRRAASRAACTAGSNSAIRMPMIVMTTRSSTRVKLADW